MPICYENIIRDQETPYFPIQFFIIHGFTNSNPELDLSVLRAEKASLT